MASWLRGHADQWSAVTHRRQHPSSSIARKGSKTGSLGGHWRRRNGAARRRGAVARRTRATRWESLLCRRYRGKSHPKQGSRRVFGRWHRGWRRASTGSGESLCHLTRDQTTCPQCRSNQARRPHQAFQHGKCRSSRQLIPPEVCHRQRHFQCLWDRGWRRAGTGSGEPLFHPTRKQATCPRCRSNQAHRPYQAHHHGQRRSSRQFLPPGACHHHFQCLWDLRLLGKGRWRRESLHLFIPSRRSKKQQQRKRNHCHLHAFHRHPPQDPSCYNPPHHHYPHPRHRHRCRHQHHHPSRHPPLQEHRRGPRRRREHLSRPTFR